MIKIKVFGFRGTNSSISSIEEGLIKLGCELSDKPDVVLELCGLYQTAEDFCASLDYTPKKIYNLLDIDPNKDISFYSEAIEHLNNADIITTISNFVKNDIIAKLGIKKSIEVIYYPIKQIEYENFLKTLSFVHVGRVLSKNKRFSLVGETLDLLNVSRNGIIVIGPEIPAFGKYLPNVTDDTLSWIYNSAEFCFCLSSSEGLYLPAIESVIASCSPVLCNDLKIVDEWGLGDFVSPPDPKGLATKINEIHTNRGKYTKIMDKLRPEFIEKFSLDNYIKRLYNLICSV